jgi:hypothetical protein
MTEQQPPPRRAPFHREPIGGKDHAVTPQYTLDGLALRLSTVLELDAPFAIGDWLVHAGEQPPRRYGEPFAAALLAEHRKSGETRRVRLDIAVHASGWVEAVVAVEGFEPRSFFIERAYEEFAIWPPDSPGEAVDSGRMGKNASWVQLDARHWPDLSGLAQGGFVTLDSADSAA